MSVSVFNRCWARIILESLVRQGVRHFCLAPGSRSTPLTLEAVALQQQKRVVCHTHFDERGLGFFALGLAKVRKEPVAIMVTSGTAAANLYPAIIEARQTQVNLVVLTADRPLELLECGANQAILQENMFADYPVAKVHLPRPSQDYSPQWLLSHLAQAYQRQDKTAGVVHINVPFPEPLYEADEEAIAQHPWWHSVKNWLQGDAPWVISHSPLHQTTPHPDWEIWREKKGVILAGRLTKEEGENLNHWANMMGWITITDVQANMPPSLPYADIWLANDTVRRKLLEADILIQFGEGFVSKRVNQFLDEYQGEYWVVNDKPKNVDPYHHQRSVFSFSLIQWINAHEPLRQKPWLLEPLALSKFCTNFISDNLGSALNEASLAYNLDKLLPSNCDVFIGNSLFVRLADAFACLPEGCRVFTNRGASGIDGLIATTAGIAVGGERPLIAVLGDTSVLYDLNSLALLQRVSQPTIIFVLNNNGGAIFDLLPVPAKVKEKYYQMPHHLEFSACASLFNVKYVLPRTWSDINSVLRQAYKQGGATIIEIKVTPTTSSHFYRYVLQEIANAVIGDESKEEKV